MTSDVDSELLKKVAAVMKVEAKLSRRLEEVEPWLPSLPQQHDSSSSRLRVRPIPTTMDEVHQVLAVARSLAARTSAPAGWNPNAPVIGFSTPAPLPNQLRNGSLAALQLKVVQQESKRQKIREQQQQDEHELSHALDIDEQQRHESTPATPSQPDAKRGEVSVHNRELGRSISELQRLEQQQARRQQQQQRTLTAAATTGQVDISMNLSDSSSEDDED
ncbi:hypothetical protein MPSEU_000891700 [Mayamaea pseudoterrestris]|nr:hypothetical protein MPSEU_000891700 [Mayamaea pseudoterrestris]